MPPRAVQPKLTIADCQRIQRAIEEKSATVANLARAHNVSKTIIYQIRDGEYCVQKQVAEAALPQAQQKAGDECPGCGLPTGFPCLSCAAQVSPPKPKT